MKYAGNGRWLPGVPARDLEDFEAKQYGEARLLASGLYERPKATKKEAD